jgi:hypothetical protein
MTQQHAVDFDWTVYRAWLDLVQLNSVDGRTNRDSVEAFTTGYQKGSDEAGWLVEAALNAVRDATVGDGVDVWATGPGVGNVYVWTVADPEGGQSGITGEVIVDGVPLSLGKLDDDELVHTEEPMLPGWEAAEQALATLADQVNTVVAHYRKTTGPNYPGFEDLSHTDIREALVTLALTVLGGDEITPSQAALGRRVARLWAQNEVAGTDAEVVEAEIVDNEVADI